MSLPLSGEPHGSKLKVRLKKERRLSIGTFKSREAEMLQQYARGKAETPILPTLGQYDSVSEKPIAENKVCQCRICGRQLSQWGVAGIDWEIEGDTCLEVGPGDVLHIPVGTPHQFW